jgi:hypothetical protein
MMVKKVAWSDERIERLRFLVDSGWDAKRIAGDPIIATSANNVHRQAQRFGMRFRAVVGVFRFVPKKALDSIDAAAAKRGITRQMLLASLLSEMDATLINNILDDEFSREVP